MCLKMQIGSFVVFDTVIQIARQGIDDSIIHCIKNVYICTHILYTLRIYIFNLVLYK
jgi:hypothetical protein